MQRILAALLILIGVAGLVLGRLGETTWAPETQTTASVELDDPGPAVVIDPGVLYIGGQEGRVTIEGEGEVSLITAGGGDIDAYLEGVHHTRITGASDWQTLSVEEVEPEGEAEIADPTSSDLWRTVDTSQSPATIDVAEFWAQENDDNLKPYRQILIVTDGTAPGASKVSITWPVDAENEWVPYAYAGGAAIAVVGLVLLVVSVGRGSSHPSGRRRRVDDAAPPRSEPAESVAGGSEAADLAAPSDDDPTDDPTTEQLPTIDDEEPRR